MSAFDRPNSVPLAGCGGAGPDHYGSGVQHEFATTSPLPTGAPSPARPACTASDARARLRALLPPGVRMPATGGWAVSADLLVYLVDVVREHRPAHIVEIGSGTSTCWLAWALQAFDVPGRVVSLEHLPSFRRRTRVRLRAWGVQHLAEVRLASLTGVPVGDTIYRWYDPAAWDDLRECDLLLVDGPPGRTGPLARYPAVPLLEPALRPGARVVLDDYKRPKERDAVAGWRLLHPDWRLQVLEHRKGTAVLTVR